MNLIFPSDALESWNKMAAQNGLFPQRIMQVFPRGGKPASRVMVEFRKEDGTVSHGKLFIRNREGNYTDSTKNSLLTFTWVYNAWLSAWLCLFSYEDLTLPYCFLS